MKLAVFHHDKAGMNQKHCRDADHPRSIARFCTEFCQSGNGQLDVDLLGMKGIASKGQNVQSP